MLILDLKPIFNFRSIDRPYAFLVDAGFTAHSATSIVSGSAKSLKLQHIEMLCKVLVCEPNDLFSFQSDKNEILATDHPLLTLQNKDQNNDWRRTLASIPFKQLKELTKNLSPNNNT